MNKLSLSVLLLLFSLAVTAQQDHSSKVKAEMDSISNLIKDTYEVPGLAIGIILDDEVYYSNALGVQDVESQAPLTMASLFHMASVSKPFVATAIMQLVESGKMNLEDKLIDHLPYFSMKDERFREITILQILNHSSGIPDVEDYEWDQPQLDDGAAERYAKSLTGKSLDFAPGEDFSYSNVAFDILADVIAKISGLTFEDYMTQHIFEPAGMSNSTFYKPEVPEKLATQPHRMGGDLQMEKLAVYPYNRIHAPSSTLHSNVEDMLKWAQVYLHRGKINGKQIFSEASYQRLISPSLEISHTRSIGLSWFTRSYNETKLYFHSGGDEGYRTFFVFFPERKAAIFLMGNNDHLQSGTAAIYLANNLILDNPKSWKKPIHFELRRIILSEGIDSCKSFYFQAKEQWRDQYQFRAGNIDQLGYWLLDHGKNQEALDLFIFNTELFPKESGFYDSVGDAYVALKNTPKAIEWYEKALEINPKQDFTIEKLNKLKK